MFRLIFLRIIREYRLMAVLLLSMCLVTGFLALGPLYLQAVSVSDFNQRIDNAAAVTLAFNIRNDVPFSEEVPNLIDSHLSEYIGVQRAYATIGGFQCGYIYDEQIPDHIGGGSGTISCYRPYAYDDLSAYFTLAEGRFPENTDSEIVEAIITVAASEEGNYPIGHHFIMGEDPNNVVIVEIVGLVELILPRNAPFWLQQTMPTLVETAFSPVDVRSDVSFAVTIEAFESRVLDIAEGETYVRQFDILPETLSAFNVNDIAASMLRLEESLRLLHPDISISTFFSDLLANYRRGIENAQGPITILSFLVLVLMLYNIVATASLILEQQSEEWSMMASRGASYFQLLLIQFVTTLLLGIVAAISGPFVAYLIMAILATVGPYAAIIDITQIGAIPQFSFALSAIAAAIIVLVLTIPAWSFASRSLQQLKTSMARAPKAPIWARYYFDIVILVAGIAFVARLFSLSTDESLTTVLLNPALLMQVLSGSASSNLFADAFNLAGPVLLLLGASMLWLRVFPILIRLIGGLVANGDGLTIRLAFWNVERDPAHYAQLVLLLIGTLALGTSSLALSQTRAVGGWAAAQSEVGADATLSIESLNYDSTINWDAFPDVLDAVPVMRIIVEEGGRTALVALDPDNINGASFTTLAEPFTVLADNPYTLSGLELPTDTNTLRIDVYARAPQDEGIIDSQLAIVLEDITGRTATIAFQSNDSTAFERFVTYETPVIDFGEAPYRMVGITLLSNHDTVAEFEHMLYLDNLVSVNVSGETTLVNGFEPDTYDKWQWISGARQQQVLYSTAFTNVMDIVSEGTHSLRVLHLMEDQFQTRTAEVRPARMTYDDRPLPPIPVVVSRSFANAEGLASRFRRPLEIGDSLSASFNLPTVLTAIQRVEFPYRIVGIIDYEYPSFVRNEKLIFVDYQLLRYRLNTYSFTAQYLNLFYDYNTVWFDFDERQPTDAFINQLESVAGFIDADYAWARFSEIQRDPLSNAVTGMLFAGFWVSLFLSLMDFAFYMAITIRRRALAFATLQAIGWNEQNLLNLLLVEQIAFITPALIIGIFFGMLLATIILPFLSLVGSLELQIPILSILILIGVLALSFALILRFAAFALRRLSLNQVMRFGE